jgi:hypothetical protein
MASASINTDIALGAAIPVFTHVSAIAGVAMNKTISDTNAYFIT